MNQKNPKSEGFGQGGSNFDSGFGGSAFGGGSQFGGGAGGGSEFGNPSAFGGTNAVSQIFKEGGFDDSKRKRTVIISAAVAAVVVCGGAAWWLFSGGETTQEEVKVEAPVAQPAEEVAATEEVVEEEEVVDEGEMLAEDDVVSDAGAMTTVDSQSVTYDARQGGIVVNATDGALVEVSRRSDFSDTYVTGRAVGGRFQIPLPPPGTIYWREEGSSEARVITITPPEALGLNFSPAQTLPATEASFSWSASGPASYYRVEFANDADFANIVTVLSTAQTSATANELAAGKYFVRVGGYNLAAGRWEFSRASSVSVE